MKEVKEVERGEKRWKEVERIIAGFEDFLYFANLPGLSGLVVRCPQLELQILKHMYQNSLSDILIWREQREKKWEKKCTEWKFWFVNLIQRSGGV